MRFLRQNLLALLALMFAITGTGFAASQYIITSKSQIRPSVLRALGDLAVTVLRSRSLGPVKTTSGLAGATEVPLNATTWTQGPSEFDRIVGEYDVSTPSTAECGKRKPSPKKRVSVGSQVFLYITYEVNAYAIEEKVAIQATPTTTRQSFYLMPQVPFPPPGSPTTRPLEVRVEDDCPSGVHATINWVHIDVIGVR